MSSIGIQQLLKNQAIWQASEKGTGQATLSTGYQALDQKLHYAGWPQGGLSELLLAHPGVGEIRLLYPLLAKLSRQSGYIAWVNPPYLPYAPALSNLGIQLAKQVVVRAKQLTDTIWAAQQAMNSKACAAVLVWLPEKSALSQIRKLSLAAKNANCWGILLRAQSLQQQASPACLRIVLEPARGQQQLSIIKQPGGWSGQQVKLNLFPERAYWNPLAVKHWPVFTPQPADLSSHVDAETLSSKTSTILTLSTAKQPSYH